MKICRQFIHKISFFLFCLAVTMVLARSPVFLPWNIDKAFIGTAFLIMGHELKQTKFMEKYINHPNAISVAITFILFFFYKTLVDLNPGVNMSLRIYGSHGDFSVILFVCAGFLGSTICIIISKLLDCLLPFLTIFATIGRESLAIMSVHLILFRILDTLWLSHITFHYWTIAMLRISLTIALIIYTCYIVRHIRRKIYDMTSG